MYREVHEVNLWDTTTGTITSKKADWCEGGMKGELAFTRVINSKVVMEEWEHDAVHMSHLAHEVRWVTYLIDELTSLIAELDELYAALGVIETAGQYLWKWRAQTREVGGFPNPPSPPV